MKILLLGKPYTIDHFKLRLRMIPEWGCVHPPIGENQTRRI